MKIEKEVLQSQLKVTDIICDICGESCHTDYGFEFATLIARWGYMSHGKDMTEHECHQCEDCYDKINKFIESLGGKVRVTQLF